MNAVDLSICGLYLVMTLVIGGLVGKKQHSTEDYFLAGRKMKWWPIAISLFASLFSAISYIAIPGEAYNFGCTMLLGGLTAVIALPVMLLIFLRFFYRMRFWTINEYLERRFSVTVRVVNSVLFLLIRLVYLGVVLYATAFLLRNALGWSPVVSILAVGLFATAYTCMGGMEAVVWTDVFQFVVLLGGILVVIALIAWETPGGVAGIWEIAAENKHTFNVGADSGLWDLTMHNRISIWPWLIGIPFAMILPATDQINLQRCQACKDFREVTRAVIWSTVGTLPVSFLFYFAGLAVFAYFKVLHPAADPGSNGDEAFCHYITTYLPVGFRGLLAAGVLAAVMSTVDSVINSLSTVFVRDIYERVLATGRSDNHYLRVAKLSTLLIGLASCGFGLLVVLVFHGRDIALWEVSYVTGAVLGAFSSAIFIMGLLTRRTNAKGMLWGLAAAVPVAIYFTIFRYLLRPPGERISFLFLSLLVIFSAMLTSYLYSLFTGACRPEQLPYVIWTRFSRKNRET